MYLIAEIGLFFFAFYRGRGLEALVALLVFIGTIFGLVEFGYEDSLFIHGADILFMVALGVMGLFPKKDKRPRCPQCSELIDKSRLSCSSCGYLFSDQESVKQTTEYGSVNTKVIKSIDEFETIKQDLIERFGILGYNTKAIDKENTLMLKNLNLNNSYVIVKRNGFEVTTELFNVEE